MILLQRFRVYLRQILDPSDEQEREEDTVEAIRKGIVFRGTNLWVLIFATFIASLGLNTNSTAVIIGAMLISPLMGPIMGIGLGVGINDFELIKKAFRNLLIATIFSVLTSTLYFLLSPLNEARSELLARTTPTIYDVLIAFFWWDGGNRGVFDEVKRKRDSGSGYCYRFNAAVVYGRVRAGEWQPELFLRGILFVHDQFGIYRGCHDFRSTVDAFFEKEIHG